jgi:hypothetical protein
MTRAELSRAEWRTSSYSSQDGNCVEVAPDLAGRVLVRDTKNRDDAVLALSAAEWRRFTGALK